MALNKILVATDFSEDAQMAVERAAQLAAAHSAQLYLVHIASLPVLNASLLFFGNDSGEIREKVLQNAQECLAQAVDDLLQRYEIAISAEVLEGCVSEEIMCTAADAAVDLIVLGAHGENRLREILLGTTAECIIGKTAMPILIVRKYPRAPYNRVLIPVDFSEYSLPAFQFARDIIMAGEITLLHAFELPFENRLRRAGVNDEVINEHLASACRQAAIQLDKLADAGDRRYFINRQVLHGPVSRLVIEQVKAGGIDLVVMGRHARSPVEELLFGTVGSMTYHVLVEAPCDVLVCMNQENRAQYCKTAL